MIGRAAGRGGLIAAVALVAALIVGLGGLVILNSQLVSAVPASTLTLRVPSARFSTDDPSLGLRRVAPQLDSMGPTTAGVAVNSTIVMTFSLPMDRPSVETSFRITPAAEGRLAWSDDFTLRFEPFRLAYSTSYQVEVRGRSVRGVPLSGSRSWNFTTVFGPIDAIPPGATSIKVPILTYHYIRVNPNAGDRMGFALSVTPAAFAAEMDWLVGNGYHAITTEDLYAYLTGARGLPSRPVILTFDDGYADFYTTALPVLRNHDFRAVAYVVSGFIGQPGYMTAAQVREADRSGIEIASHTVSHANLVGMSAGAVRSQLADSKRILEQLVGHPVVSFCYPGGRFNSGVASEVAAAGYHDATTTRFGFWHSLADRYAWTRLRVSGGERLDEFAVAVLGAT